MCMGWLSKLFQKKEKRSAISQSWLAYLEGKLETEDDGVVVAVIGDRAFWIADEGLITARATPEGIDLSTAMLYNAIEADQEELNMVQYVVDQLTERNKDG